MQYRWGRDGGAWWVVGWGEERKGEHEVAVCEVYGGARNMDREVDIIRLFMDEGGV